MKVKLISLDPTSDPLVSSPEIPTRLQPYLVPNALRTFNHTKQFEYLEQRYLSDDCIICFLDIFAGTDCIAQPVADSAMLTIVYMLYGTVPCVITGFGNAVLHQGYSYLFYLPQDSIHQAHLKKEHTQVVFCYFSQSYLDNMAKEYDSIRELLAMFSSGSPAGLIEKVAPVTPAVMYQLWQVRECEESPAFKESNLKARGLDLVLDYIRESNRSENTYSPFNRDAILRQEKIFQAKKIIDDHQHGKLLIAEIARKTGINVQQLKKIFRETFKMTIGKYQAEQRFARARHMLLETDEYVSDIALKVGYEDHSSLIRIFRKRLNTTPQKFRMQGRTNF